MSRMHDAGVRRCVLVHVEVTPHGCPQGILWRGGVLFGHGFGVGYDSERVRTLDAKAQIGDAVVHRDGLTATVAANVPTRRVYNGGSCDVLLVIANDLAHCRVPWRLWVMGYGYAVTKMHSIITP